MFTHAQQAVQQRVIVCTSQQCHDCSRPFYHIQVRGWPVEVVFEGVTFEFVKSRNSSPVREASVLILSITGSATNKPSALLLSTTTTNISPRTTITPLTLCESVVRSYTRWSSSACVTSRRWGRGTLEISRDSCQHQIYIPPKHGFFFSSSSSFIPYKSR